MAEYDFSQVLDEVYAKVRDHLAARTPRRGGRLSRLARLAARGLGRGGVWAGNLFLNDQLKRWAVDFLANYGSAHAHLAKLYRQLMDETSRRTMQWFVRYRLAYALAGPVAGTLYPHHEYFQIPDGEGEWIDASTWRRDGEDFVFEGPVEEIRRQMEYSLARNQYRLPGLLDARPGDHVIDAGACYGDTTVWYARRVGGEGRVYAFEAMAENQDILRRNVEINHCARNVSILPMALWDRETRLHLHSGAGGSSKVEEGHGDIEAWSLDALVEAGRIERVDFIKSDLEGAERRLLYGAKKVFPRFRPRLALSVYHGGEGNDDLYEIPRIVNEYCGDYDFHLRCLTATSFETVLFGIPREGGSPDGC